jgi:hypothetical protein
VQHPHFSVRIPPLFGKSREAADFGGIDGSVRKDI